MRRRTILIAPFVALICAAGFATALLSFPATAAAWSPTSLPPGWTIEHDTGGLDPDCQDAYRIWTDTHVFSGLFCTASPSYQQDFDAWVDAHYTAPATTAPPTTTDNTVPVTTAPTATDATTTAAAPVGTTTADPGAPTPTTTTPTAVCDVACLNARVAVLEQSYAALAGRVDAIAKANDASWAAFVDALNAGASTVDAAIAARSAGLNAIYQL
jgi:hypothetical protein